MDEKYQKAIEAENNVYLKMKEGLSIPKGKSTGWGKFDMALDWLCTGTESILDFGCGNGTLLFICANRGTKRHYGIDLAREGIACADLRAKMMDKGEYYFEVGSIEALHILEDKCVDAILLSNILDNMYPDDVKLLLSECNRILKDNGKILIKLNPFITDEQIKEWNMKELQKNVYDDGFILWNRKTSEWVEELSSIFKIVDEYEFLIPEAELVNRIILVEKY